MGEGWNASVAVSRLSNGVLNYHNAGKVQASSEPQDMRLQRMLGHLTTLIPKNPKNALVIGCGAGVTAGAVSIDPAVKKLTIAEIEPLVPSVVSKYFSEHNFSVVTNPKTRIHIDDARHFLMTTDEKFDAITSDPLDPWVKGAAMLYSREFFETVKQRLNPGGVVTLFVQLYESNTEAVKSEVATFLEAFPERDGLRQHQQRPGLRHGPARPGRADRDQPGRDPGRSSPVPSTSRSRSRWREIGMNNGRRPVLDLCRQPQAAAAVARRRDDQSRPQPEAAVPRRPRRAPLSERRDLRADAAPRRLPAGHCSPAPTEMLLGSAAGHATAARAITARATRCDAGDVNARFGEAAAYVLRAACLRCGSSNYSDHTEASVSGDSQG